MRADVMPLHSYSRCPLKKRPVHFCYDSEETKDDNHEEDDALEPENLSTKPEDLRLSDKTKATPTAAAPLSNKRHPVKDRTGLPTTTGSFLQSSCRPFGYSFQCGISNELSSENPASNEVADPGRTNFPSWHHIAPHCLPYLYPYPYAEDVYSQYFTSSVPLQQHRTYSSQESTPSHVACTSVTSLSNKYEAHRTTDVDCLSPTSSASSSRYNFLGTPTPPRTPEELLSPRSVSSSDGSSAGSTGYGLRTVENKSANRYQCSFCSKSYTTYSGLSKHQQFHCAGNEEPSSKKKFSCKSCDKVYVTLGALKMHIRTHTLPCKCVICGKAFSRPWLLQGHIRTHTGEKPFSCPLCERAFADRSNLRAHLQTHSEVKKYSCASCGKTFSRMSLLTKHVGGGCLGPGHSSEDFST